MRNFFLVILLVSGLLSCNDNTEKTENATGDSSLIETPVDSSNAVLQTDSMPKQNVDTIKAEKPAKKRK